ncbi:TonB-dependent siderophore receptor [Aureimonas mangrovi]|uniref:TonB-dependent siderophore receptor n=1 Tax=Aureimonas mangrovi TaxID=2758041 RepID=UPI00163D4467|nr:TonB-dependent siderophore receptor [Aureimonas mangrovi]
MAGRANYECRHRAPVQTTATARVAYAASAACGALLIGVSGAFAQTSQSVVVLDPVVIAVGAESGEGGVGAEGPRSNPDGYLARTSASATKTSTPISETPQSISVITRDSMDDRAVQSVADSMLYTTGVNAQRYGNDPRSDYFTVRGFPADLYLDGLRVPQIANQTGGYAGFRIEPFFLNRVEVLRGPNSALFGQTNVGGVVNMISKDPQATAGGEVYTRFGTNSQKEVGFDVTGPLNEDKTLTYRLMGVWRDADTDIYLGKNDRFAISPSISYKPDADTSFTLYGAFMRDDLGQVGAIVPALGSVYPNSLGLTIPRDFSDGDPHNATYEKDTGYVGYRFEHRFENEITVRQNFRYSHLDVAYDNLFTRGILPDERTITRMNYRAHPTLDALALDTNAEYRFHTGAVAHTLLAGVDLQWQKLDNSTGSTTGFRQDLFDPRYDSPIAPQPATNRLQQVQRQTGVYLQDQIEWGRLRVTAGIRQDFAEIESDSTALTSGVTTSYTQDPNEFTGRIGAAYVFDNGITPYALYSTSFQPVLTLADVPLKPTTGELIEAGLKFAPLELPYSLTVSAFEATQQNVVNRTAGVYYQTDEVRVRGVEVEATARLFERLDVIAGLTFQEPEITRSRTAGREGNMPYTVPKQQQSIFLSYDVPLPEAVPGELKIGGGVRRIGETAGDDANTFFVPSYTLADAFARYEINNLSLQVNATNLGDEDYVAGCNISTQCYYGPGRSVIATASVKW